MVIFLVLAALLVPSAALADDWPACTPRSGAVRTGVKEVGRERAGRLLTLTLRSRAMQSDVKVAVALPRGYDASGKTRYPVLLLLHGAADDHSAWPDHGAVAATDPLGAIVVMPDGGADGSYSDWYGTEAGTPGPVPAWESFHLRELIPYIDRSFPTRTDPGARAIAGLSSGGHGAAKYAALAPGSFGFLGVFSGAVDLTNELFRLTIKQCAWGDPAVHDVLWRDSNPTDLAPNLRGTSVFVRAGNGKPGPLDPAGQSDDLIETVVGQMNQTFVAALKAGGVRPDAKLGTGTHTWPYWQRDLEDFVAAVEPRFGKRLAAPRTLSLRSARRAFTAWGWTFAVRRRRATEFAYLDDVSAKGLTATGSGRLAVTTAALFRPGRRYRVGGATRVADRRGRLAFTVDLGPGHTTDQTTFGAGPPKGWRAVRTAIRAAR